MIFYHGTVDTFVPAILKDGLTPTPDNRWKITLVTITGRLDPDDSDREPAVYCTPLQAEAKRYAINKSRYYQTKSHKNFKWDALPGWGSVTGIKGSDPKYLPDCKPVVLKLTLPAGLASRFEEDYKADDAYLCTCTIPAKYIEVLNVPDLHARR